jgi:hypothetical protein
MGGGLTSGAIIQHLAKLRGKMLQAKISVPPKLGRGTVAKEPSKIYGTNNGKKLPPPVFAAPSTPIQATPKSKPKSKGKGKRARDEVDSDEDIDDYPEDDDDDYGTFKKKSRTSRARPKASASKTGDRKSKRRQADLAAANEEINDDILRTIEDDDGGPASRTRHIKQDFSKMDEPYSDVEEAEEEEEDEEEEEEGGGEEEGVADKFETPQMRSPTSIKEEGPVSPRTTVPRNSNNNLKVYSNKLSVNIDILTFCRSPSGPRTSLQACHPPSAFLSQRAMASEHIVGQCLPTAWDCILHSRLAMHLRQP